ncbi:amidase [Ilyonectria robusta]
MLSLQHLLFRYWGGRAEQNNAVAPFKEADLSSAPEFMFQIEEAAFLARRSLHQSRILDPAITGLCTVLRPPTLVSSEWLQDKVEKWNQDDDVLQSSFTANNEAFHEYRNLPCSTGCRLMIGAPSKLYTPKSEKKPLNGLRISVKDDIDLAGIKTTLSCRSWERLYFPKDTTAAAVQRLLDLGAIVVGKTKLSQFAEVESPTADWVDTARLIPARMIGLMSASGPIREGASGKLPLSKAYSHSVQVGMLCPWKAALDTIGFLCRDVDVLHEVATAWLGDNNEPNISNLTKITVLSDFEYGPGLAKRVFDNFVSRLEEVTHVQGTKMSIIDNWKQKSPSCDGKGLIEYIGKAEESTADGQNAALQRKEMFKKWFLDSVLSVEAPNELTAITVAPISDEEPKYRDDYKQGPWMGGNGFHRNFVSPLTGCPEVVVPIGQIPYQSRVTKRQEFLPIVVAILGPPEMALNIDPVQWGEYITSESESQYQLRLEGWAGRSSASVCPSPVHTDKSSKTLARPLEYL